MKEKIRSLFKGPILSSIFYIALGVVLVLLPTESVTIICKIVFGAVMILAGVYHIIIHILDLNNATVLDSFSGVILTVFGVFLFMNPLIIVKLLPILLGGFVLVDSFWTLKGAIQIKKLRRENWKLLILVSAIFIVLAVTLIINPFKVVRYTVIFAGATLMGNGIFDLVFWVMIRVAVKKGLRTDLISENHEDISMNEQNGESSNEKTQYEEWSNNVNETVLEVNSYETSEEKANGIDLTENTEEIETENLIESIPEEEIYIETDNMKEEYSHPVESEAITENSGEIENE